MAGARHDALPENPFASAAANPFADQGGAEDAGNNDPFDDPAVRAAAHGEGGGADIEAAAAQQRTPLTNNADAATHEGTPILPWMETSVPMPSYGSAGVPVGGGRPKANAPVGSSLTGTTTREEELAERERILAERERELTRREYELGQSAAGYKPPNWPKCRPMYYHDIDEEVLPDKRSLVHAGYKAWMLSVAGYVMNWIAITALVSAGAGGYGIDNFFWASMNLIGGIYFSWTCWYQSLYKAGMTDAAVIPHVTFFVHFAVHTFWCYFTVASVPYLGNFMAGVFTAIFWAFPNGVFYGVLCVLNIGIWSLDAFVSSYVLAEMFRRFRGAGGVDATRQQGNLLRSVFLQSGGSSIFTRTAAPPTT